MSKVIFLDIDGVLNNQNHIEKLVELLGEEQYFQLNKDLGEMPFDYRSCKWLHKLIKETDAEIILSSTWRMSKDLIKGIEKFAEIKIKDITPILQDIRGKEIQQYLDTHKEITNYVIIDDDTDMLKEQFAHFSKTNFMNGFTEQNYIECKNILQEGDDK